MSGLLATLVSPVQCLVVHIRRLVAAVLLACSSGVGRTLASKLAAMLASGPASSEHGFARPRRTNVLQQRQQQQRQQRDAHALAELVVHEYEHDFGSLHPPFFLGSYYDAVAEAKRQHRPVLVVLLSEEHAEHAAFGRQVLASSLLLDFVAEHSVIVWLGNVLDLEPFHVSEALACTRFPFACLLSQGVGPRPSSAVSVLLRLEGVLDPHSFVAALVSVEQQIRPVLARYRNESAGYSAARAVRAQQDSAYQVSLARDRARAQARQRELQERERALREVEERRKELLAVEEKQKSWLSWRAHKLQNSLAALSSISVARISIRNRNGQRINHSFPQDCTVEDIYAYVACQNIANDKLDGFTSNPPEDYTHHYDFQLVSPLPRKVIPPDPSVKVCDQRLLWPSGNLIVEDVGDDDYIDD